MRKFLLKRHRLALALLMLFAAFTQTRADDNVAKIGDTEYATLQAAIDAATAGQTVTLTQNITATEMITINKALTLNLNGHTLSGTISDNWAGSSLYSIKTLLLINCHTKDVKITDSSADKKGEISASGDMNIGFSAVTVYYGKLTITDATITATNKNAGGSATGVSFYEEGTTNTLNVETGATITASGYLHAYGINCVGSNHTDAAINIEGGKITSTVSGTTSVASDATGISTNAVTKIIGGDITVENKNTATSSIDNLRANGIIVQSAGSLTISGGNVSATAPGYVKGIYVRNKDNQSGTFEMTGGTVSSKSESGVYCAAVESEGTTTISGGTLTAENTNAAYAYGLYVTSGTAKISENANINSDATRSYTVYVNGGTLNVCGGTITSNYSGSNSFDQARGIYVHNGTATISGGIINANTASTNYAVYIDATTGTNTISGGYFYSGPNTHITVADILNEGKASLTISGGYFKHTTNVSKYLVSGKAICVGNSTYPYQVATAVATIGSNSYASLADAVDAAPVDGTQTTIKILADTKGTGVQVKEGKNIVFDLQNHTYEVTNPTVGSKGTETNGFQLLKGSTVKFQNGKLLSSTAIYLIQNYSDLTLTNVTLDESEYSNIRYVISNNCGSLTTTGNTVIKASKGNKAFDVYYWYSSYPEGVTVTINDSTIIDGTIEYDAAGGSPDNWEEKAKLNINGGTFTNFSINLLNTTTSDKAGINISGGTFSSAINEDYCADNFVPTLVNGKYTVEKATENNAVSYTTTEDWLTEKNNSRAYITGSKIELTDNDTLANGKYWSFKVPVEKKGQTITYTRTFSNDKDQCWFVPFSVNVNDYADDVRFYKISLTSDGNIRFSSVDDGTLNANYPYVVRLLKYTGKPVTVNFASADGILYKTDDTQVVNLSSSDNNQSSKYSIQGAYTAKPTSSYYGWYTLNSNGKLSLRDGKVTTANLTLKPFRWFLNDVGSTNSRSSIGIVYSDDDITGINVVPVPNTDNFGVIYNLQGQRVTNPSKGIYIINGKKVIIK